MINLDDGREMYVVRLWSWCNFNGEFDKYADHGLVAAWATTNLKSSYYAA